MLDKNGVVLRDPENGKIKYVNMFEFSDRATREAFSDAVIDAVLRALLHRGERQMDFIRRLVERELERREKRVGRKRWNDR